MFLNLLGVMSGGFLVGFNIQEGGSKSLMLLGVISFLLNSFALYNLLK